MTIQLAEETLYLESCMRMTWSIQWILYGTGYTGGACTAARGFKEQFCRDICKHCATESMMQANGFVFRTNFNNDDDYEQYKEIYENSYTLFQQKLLSGGYKVYTSINMDVQQMLQDAVDDNLKGYTAEKDGVYEMQAAATCIDNSTGNVVLLSVQELRI